MNRIILISIFISLIIPSLKAYVDGNGHESKQFILDYSTGIRTEIKIETPNDIDKLENQLPIMITYSNEAEGATVEWTINSGLFHNISGWPELNQIWQEDNAYNWSDRTGTIFAEYCINDNSWYEEPVWNSYLLPGSIDWFKLQEGKKITDISIKLISFDYTDINDISLIPSLVEPCDRSVRESNHRFSIDKENLIKKYQPSHIDNSQDVDFRILCYHGLYDEANKRIMAITNIKYQVMNALFLPPIWLQCNNMDIKPIKPSIIEYFTLHGDRISQPTSPGIFIKREGNTFKKIIHK